MVNDEEQSTRKSRDEGNYKYLFKKIKGGSSVSSFCIEDWPLKTSTKIMY